MRAFRSSPPTSRAISPASRPRQRQGRPSSSAPRRSASTTCRTASRSCSGTCSASRGTGCARPISEMGPLLLSRLLDLNDTQEGVLNIAFRIADEQGLLLLDLKDLRALLQLIADNAQPAHDDLRQRLEGHHRHDPAPAPRAGEPAGRRVPRRAGARHQGPDAHGPRRARHRQHPGGRQADEQSAPLRHLPALAACPSCSRNCRRSAISTSPSSCSSSTRRIFSSTMRRRR